jgi:hypothetical protein
VLDISHEALAVTRRRLGSTEGRLAYVVSDPLLAPRTHLRRVARPRRAPLPHSSGRPSGVRRPGAVSQISRGPRPLAVLIAG